MQLQSNLQLTSWQLKRGMVLPHFLKELKPRTTDKERLRQKECVAFSLPKIREWPLQAEAEDHETMQEARQYKIKKKGGGGVKRRSSLCCSTVRTRTERKNEMAQGNVKKREKEIKICKYYNPQAVRRLAQLLSSLYPRLHHLAGPL